MKMKKEDLVEKVKWVKERRSRKREWRKEEILNEAQIKMSHVKCGC